MFWSKHGLRSNLRVPNLKKISWGSYRNSRNSLKELAPALLRHSLLTVAVCYPSHICKQHLQLHEGLSKTLLDITPLFHKAFIQEYALSRITGIMYACSYACVHSYYKQNNQSSSLAKERPPPTFGPIYCKGSKFAPISAHPGVNFTRLTECTRGIWEAHLQEL